MADPLGQVTDQNAIPTREVGIKERDVVEELGGWYLRLCEREATSARKQLALYSMRDGNGEIPLNYRFAGGLALESAEAWERRGEYAKRGIFLADILSQRSPEFVCNPQISALMYRAKALGLCESENPLREVGPRY
jgi:hypothetical protein